MNFKTCFDMFTEESKKTNKTKLLISAATAPDGRMSSLDIPALNKYFKKHNSRN